MSFVKQTILITGRGKRMSKFKSEAASQECPDLSVTIPSTEALNIMIAEAAYYMAESRGFCGGDPQEDWLKAEAMVRGDCRPGNN
jgi:hypothetical protein